MALELDEYVITFFLVFCRVGTCVMQIPGMASARVPARIRLFFALAITSVVSPMVSAESFIAGAAGAQIAGVILAESLFGYVIGLSARIYLNVMDFVGTLIANMIGLNGLMSGIEHEEPTAAASTIVSMTATLVILLGEMCGQAVGAVVNSYSSLPMGEVVFASAALKLLADTLGAAFMLGLQITSPFIAYGIMANLMFGILGKLVTQVPSYFISVPFVALGGLVVLYFVIPDMFLVYLNAMASKIARI